MSTIKQIAPIGLFVLMNLQLTAQPELHNSWTIGCALGFRFTKKGLLVRVNVIWFMNNWAGSFRWFKRIQYIRQSNCLMDVFFYVSVLFSNLKTYNVKSNSWMNGSNQPFIKTYSATCVVQFPNKILKIQYSTQSV